MVESLITISDFFFFGAKSRNPKRARKRHVSVWTSTQSLKDFEGHKSTESIITNATSIFLFKHKTQHINYLRKTTTLTESQLRELTIIGGDPDEDGADHKGECVLIDNNKCIFIKVDYTPDGIENDNNKAVFLKVDYLSSEKYIVETNVAKLQKMYT